MRRAGTAFLLVIVAVLAILLWVLVAVQITLPPPVKRPAAVPRRGPQLAVAPTALPSPTAPLIPSAAAAEATTALAPESTPVAGEVTSTPPAPATETALPPAVTPVSGPLKLPGSFAAADYKPGGEGVGYHDWTKGNAGGAVRSDDVDVERCAEGPDCSDVGWIAAGEWLAYDVQVDQADQYVLAVRVSAPRSGGHFHVEVNGANVTGRMSVPRTGSYRVWTNVASTPVQLPAGTFELRLVADSGGFDWRSVTVSQSARRSP